MRPTLGRVLLYTLTADDAAKINRRRTTGASIAERIKTALWPIGAQAHIGSEVKEGDVFPMDVVRVHAGDSMTNQWKVNGQAKLDGNDVYWAQDVSEGVLPGQWMWPPRV